VLLQSALTLTGHEGGEVDTLTDIPTNRRRINCHAQLEQGLGAAVTDCFEQIHPAIPAASYSGP